MMSTTTYTSDSYTYDPSTYVDAGATILPLPGLYRLRVTSLTTQKNRETGEEILQADDKGTLWPILVLNRIEIVEPFEEAGTFSIFESIRTKPYLRTGHAGMKIPAAAHMDLLRSIDQDLKVADFAEGIQEVKTLLSSGQTFVGQLGYKAQDSAWANEQIASMGGKTSMPREAYNKVWSDAKLTTKDFKNPTGGYRTQAMGRSGAMLEAKLCLTKFVPSLQSVQLGPYTR